MSVAVALDRLAEQVANLGPHAYLVTIDPDSKPHVVSVQVRLEAAELLVQAGRRTRANLGSNSKATLLWPPSSDGLYSLIVDGTADLGPDDLVALRPERAVLHRVAGTSTDMPSCVPLEASD